MQSLGLVAQSENAPTPFVPAVAEVLPLLPLLLAPPLGAAELPLLLEFELFLLLEHAVSASASAATPATRAFQVRTLTVE